MAALSRVLMIVAITFLFITDGRAANRASDASTIMTTEAPPNAAIDQASRQMVIVFLGDSLTAGFELPPDAALPEQVEARLEAADFKVDVINAGVSGDTTASGLARYDWSVASAHPDLLVVTLGANDYLMGVAPDVARANLGAILDRAKAEGTAVVLVGLEMRSNPLPGSREEAFAGIYAELSTSYNVPLYPALLEGVRDNPNLLQSDGLHPTEKGVEVIADSMVSFLLPIVETLRRCVSQC